MGRLLTPGGWFSGRLAIAGERIARIEPVEERSGPLILPGFIDLHCHGGGGADLMDGGDAVRTIARLHGQHGTSALLATTMTAPVAEIERALASAVAALRQPGEG